jgi:hypothetical protein
MVHLKTEVPAVSPVIPDFGSLVVVTVPLPETFVHNPFPIKAVLPSSVAMLEQMV